MTVLTNHDIGSVYYLLSRIYRHSFDAGHNSHVLTDSIYHLSSILCCYSETYNVVIAQAVRPYTTQNDYF